MSSKERAVLDEAREWFREATLRDDPVPPRDALLFMAIREWLSSSPESIPDDSVEYMPSIPPPPPLPRISTMNTRPPPDSDRETLPAPRDMQASLLEETRPNPRSGDDEEDAPAV